MSSEEWDFDEESGPEEIMDVVKEQYGKHVSLEYENPFSGSTEELEGEITSMTETYLTLEEDSDARHQLLYNEILVIRPKEGS